MKGTEEMEKRLVDHRGREIPTSEERELARLEQEGVGAKDLLSFISILRTLDADPTLRASEPFQTHPWVYGAAHSAALNLSQAPFGIFRETEETRDRRRAVSKSGRAPEAWPPRAGKDRRAISRWLRSPRRAKGLALKGLEPAPNHPLAGLLSSPNEALSAAEFWQVVTALIMTEGAVMLLLLNADESPVMPGDIPDEIWPMSPDLFEPMRSKSRSGRAPKGGRLIGWWYASDAGRTPLGLSEVIQIKFVNPKDPFSGFAPTAPVAGGIELDMRALAHNRAVLENGAEPGGVLTTEQVVGEDVRKEILTRWKERHSGEHNRKKTAMLHSGLKYQATGMTPQDMEYLEQRRWDRDEILSVMGVPKATLGVTDDLNFATQLAQDKNFWDKRLIPIIRLIEDTLDMTLLRQETDDVVAMFDLSNVEALRQGIGDKIEQATSLASDKLHVPPATAFRTVGLDIEDYEAADVALVSFGQAPAGEVAEGLSGLGQDFPGIEEPEEDPQEEGDDEDEAGQESARPRRKAITGRKRRRVEKNLRFWRQLMAQVQQPIERPFRSMWRRWIRSEKEKQLARFDEAVMRSGASIDDYMEKRIRGMARAVAKQEIEGVGIEAILVPEEDLRSRLKQEERPIFTSALQQTFEFTVTNDMGGIAIFEIDDPRLIQFFDRREKALLDNVPSTLLNNLRTTVRQGLEDAETVQQIRTRIAQVYDVSASNFKTLQVARTESAGFMNGARDEMFQLQGLNLLEWVTAGDEDVREDHRIFGNADPKERGFNYMTLPGVQVSSPGRLEHPNDDRAPASQVINCRCLQIPVR